MMVSFGRLGSGGGWVRRFVADDFRAKNQRLRDSRAAAAGYESVYCDTNGHRHENRYDPPRAGTMILIKIKTMSG
jgi:hypothetical protein